MQEGQSRMRVKNNYYLNRLVLYILLMVAIVAGYTLLVTGVSLVLYGSVFPAHPLAIGFAIFVVAILILPVRQKLEDVVDFMFLHGKRGYQAQIKQFQSDLSKQVNITAVISLLQKAISRSLTPVRMHIFILDPINEQYVAAPGEDGTSSSDLKFSTSYALVNALKERGRSVALDDAGKLSGFQPGDKARLALLASEVFVPLMVQNKLTGWAALGERASGEAYSPDDLNFLETLCNYSALAVERTQVVVNLETRMRETDVLARVAQGVNVLLSQDDIMELVYAQTTQIIPADDFHILLVSQSDNPPAFIFFVENGERLVENERKPIASGQYLESEVLRERKPILTDDFTYACQKWGIVPRQDAVVWMGVPLNAGADTIGVLSLGKCDASFTYTNEQLNLLQTIADQIAGAMVKIRLLQETEQRARQLSTLNEMTRQLTSTLEIEPLLKNILQNAADILNCEAGSLLFVDSQTDELVFSFSVGPMASALLNQRIPLEAGFVGQAVSKRQPLIENNVQNFPDQLQKPDLEGGYVTKSLLVVPMIVKDVVTGVIEVINKRDGSIFLPEDEELLSAFAAQAAVAVENARLFTLTDQALAARVEELSVMQRIDRELNASLDVTKAMNITLDWAMRRSNAAAGLIGVLQEGGIKIMASQGYHDELDAYTEGLLPTEVIHFEESIEQGAWIHAYTDSKEANLKGLLKGAASQVVLPIRRESQMIGVILLESLKFDPVTDEILAFLQRLSDHASIAISNAQFYAAVQSANVAKSEFVSFVSHELKNPMTSIKGYTELLAAGAVGAVNEAQANFLATIRANIERMNTLVSDLNDVSKIEANRLRLDFKGITMMEVVEETVRSTRKQIEEKGQQLELDIPSDLPMVWADRTRLAQVMVNLISNAHKYTPQGGKIQVFAEASDNDWDPAGAPKVVHAWVSDNGIGISEEDQKKIFQKFFRSEDPKTREVAGTGLGLNITRALVEMQGGKIWFESEFRRGTTFHFTVPVAG